ncbi:MAG: GNAT family N-acetyltransferase [Nocardioidaceae bacterium]
MTVGAAGRPPLPIQRLGTERLVLTPLDPAGDAPDLHLMLADSEVHRYDVDACASTSLDETEKRLGVQVMANGGASWAVRLRCDGTAVGTIGLVGDTGTTVQGIGWSLASAYWGRHIMSEAAAVIVPWLLAQDGVDGLEAWVDVRNAASTGVARAAGMTERERLPRVYADSVSQTVVLVRVAAPAGLEVPGDLPEGTAVQVSGSSSRPDLKA